MTRRTIEISAFLAAMLLAALSFHAWLASHDDLQRLQSTLATQKQVIDAADARERARDGVLSRTLARIDRLKRASQTPQEIVHDLSAIVALPHGRSALIPATDLKPLYNYVQDCRACQFQLATEKATQRIPTTRQK